MGLFEFGSRLLCGEPLTALEVRKQAALRFPHDLGFRTALREASGEVLNLDAAWRMESTSERAQFFFDVTSKISTYRFTTPDGTMVSVEDLMGEAVAEHPRDATLWRNYASTANMIQAEFPMRDKFACGPIGSEPTLSVDDITSRAVWLSPSSQHAWYDALIWSHRPDQPVRINGIDVDPVAVFVALVDRALHDPMRWYWLAYCMQEAGCSTIVLRDVALSIFDCARRCLVGDHTFSSAWLLVARYAPQDEIILEDSEPPISKWNCYHMAVHCSGGDDSLALAQYADYLQTVSPARRAEVGVEAPMDLWKKAIALAHPHRRPRALASALTSIAKTMDSDEETVTLQLYGSDEAHTMTRIELLALAVNTTHRNGLPSDQWRNRHYTVAALRLLAALIGPEDYVRVLDEERCKDDLFRFAQQIGVWAFDDTS